MENEKKKEGKVKENTLNDRYCRIHCNGYCGRSLNQGASCLAAFYVIILDIDSFLKNSASSRATVDISILKIELPDDHLDDGRSICVKQPYLNKIGGFYSLYASKLHHFMSSQKRTFAKCIDRIYSIVWTPSPSAWLNVSAKIDEKRIIVASKPHLIIVNATSGSWDVYCTIAKIDKPDSDRNKIGLYSFLPQLPQTNLEQIHWWDPNVLVTLPGDVGNVVVLIRGKQQCGVINDDQLSRGLTRWRAKPLRESRLLRASRLRQELEQKSAKNRIKM
eukprot:954962-Ditylum_brightwellii.AAC.1